MDVDEDEDATQRPKQVQNYGIEVEFDGLDEDIRENGSVADFDKEIAKLNSDIERMAPNLKAMERWGFSCAFGVLLTYLRFLRLDDVETKLADTEREADKARKDSKAARDQFNDVRRRRCVCIQVVHVCTY